MSIKELIKYPLVIPHLVFFHFAQRSVKDTILQDVKVMTERTKERGGLAHFLIHRKPYRNLFYHRIPKSRYLKLLLPEYPLFTIVPGTKIGGGAFVLNHPYATILNASEIGENFICCHLTTLGNKNHRDNSARPIIGNNVSLGANVSIIGKVRIGDNVTIGAGSVVVKDVPDNCIAVGNPAKNINRTK